jgi:hypothetical protein
VISTVPHRLHKLRRGALNPFFSKRSVAEYAGIIESLVNKLCGRLDEFLESKTPIDLRVAFAALTVDVISKYSYGTSYDVLGQPDLSPGLYRGIASGGELALLMYQFPWILKIATLLPHWLVGFLDRNVMDMIDRRTVMPSCYCTILCKWAILRPTTMNNFVDLLYPSPHTDNKMLTTLDGNRTSKRKYKRL